jgi:hypothetical protein
MSRKIVVRISLLAALAAMIGAAIASAGRSPAVPQLPSNPPTSVSKQPVVVELFTSEGCNTCPPADALLKRLSQDQPVPGTEIIALEEHVDYWNRLGWVDPYSSHDFSKRQEEYAAAFRNNGVYTPQMIVDGATEFTGSRERDADAAIKRAATHPKLTLALTPAADGSKTASIFEIRLTDVPNALRGKNLQLWVAVTETGLESNVTAGENSGQKLQHADVVRTLLLVDGFRNQVGDTARVRVPMKPEWKSANLRIVAFVVDQGSHHIVGAVRANPHA